MSDRYNSFTVVLEKDLKDEDAEPLLEAIKQFRGVLSVTPNVSNLSDHIAEARVRVELGNKLWEVLRSKEK